MVTAFRGKAINLDNIAYFSNLIVFITYKRLKRGYWYVVNSFQSKLTSVKLTCVLNYYRVEENNIGIDISSPFSS